MKKIGMRLTATLLAAMTVVTMTVPQTVSADEIEKNYLALGADLKAKERETVLRLLDVEEEDLDEYEVVMITNKDEHDYLDDYLSASVIGSRALSSVLVEKEEKGHGIEVETKNITYCTPGMYENALTTAGITDADVKVAGPFNITGTAALVGAMKAYEGVTGEKISEKSKDAATQELVVTGKVAEKIGDSEAAEKLMAKLKEIVVKKDLSDEEDIQDVIKECEDEMDITLSEEEKDQIVSLMKKIDDLDLDMDQLKEQAKKIYNKLEDIEINNQGFFEAILGFFHKILDAISK